MIGGGNKMSAQREDPLKQVPKLGSKRSDDSAMKSSSKKISTDESSSAN
jgi:hypothetical protein